MLLLAFVLELLPTKWVPATWGVVDLPEFASEILSGFVTGLVLVIVDTLCIARFGATPGKWLYRIQVITFEGQRPDYGKSFTRAAAVFVAGLGFGLRLFSALFSIIAWWRVHTRRLTYWDDLCMTEARQMPRSLWRLVGAVACTVGIMWVWTEVQMGIFDDLLDPPAESAPFVEETPEPQDPRVGQYLLQNGESRA